MKPIGSADTNYATNPDNCKSVTGNIHTVGCTLSAWTSKKQMTVMLSSSESEYVSVSAHCQETRFQQMLLDKIATSLRPAIIFEDNMGCIYLTKNQQVSTRKKHIDVRHHFIRQNIVNNNLKVCFVPTAENGSDIATKNLPEKLFKFHADNLLNGTLPYWIQEDVKTNSHLTSDLKTTIVGLDPEVSPAMNNIMMNNIKIGDMMRTPTSEHGVKDTKA